MKLPRSLCLVLSFGVAIPLVAAKCGGGYLSGGEVVSDSTSYKAVNYELTSDNYRRWLAAQDALDSANVDASVHLNTRQLTDADIDRAIDTLERQPAVRSALQSTGMTARDYVLSTIALAQSWDAVNSPTVRVTGLPTGNVDFLRRRASADRIIRERPRARVVDDDSDDDDDDDDSERGGRKRGKGHGKGHSKGHR